MLKFALLCSTCLLLLLYGTRLLSAAPLASAPAAPVTQPTLARRLADATTHVKAARAAMDAAKIDAIRRYDAGKGRFLALDLVEKASAAENADALDPQARMNALTAHLLAKSELERAHWKAIETDPGVAAATQAVATAHADREKLRREVDAGLVESRN